jgi:hypothetical protein
MKLLQIAKLPRARAFKRKAELAWTGQHKEKKWRDLSWCMEDFPAHGFGCH